MAQKTISLLVCLLFATFQMAMAYDCHAPMIVKTDSVKGSPTMNMNNMAPSIMAATNAKNVSATYQIPRKDAIKYCKDFYSAKSKMMQVLEVVPTVSPKVPSLVYLSASNDACKNYKTIKPSSTIQLSVKVVNRDMNVIIDCPKNVETCTTYDVMKPSKAQSGRRLNGENSSRRNLLQCIPLGAQCTPGIGSCCSNGALQFECDSNVCQAPCFPGDATVELEDGSYKALDSLRLTDRIKVMDKSTGVIRVESAVMWLHRSPSKYARYLRISAMDVKTNSTVQLRISGNHFLPANSKEPSFATAAMGPARDVQPGWYVWTKSSSSDAASPAIVTSVTEEIMRGVYSLLTDSGTIIVDGVAASNHADIFLADGSLLSESFVKKENIPALHHAFLTPLRLAAKLAGPRVMESVASRFESGSATTSFGNYVSSLVTMAKAY